MQHGLVPYVVFDGGPLPNKKEEEDARSSSRKEHREKAQALWRQGSTVAAMEYYQRAVDITPDIAHQLVQELQRRSIQYVVAPYEADAQCAYLVHQGIVDVVMTEDSDLLTYGCQHVLFKCDGVEADQIKFNDLPHCRELSFVGWDLYLFQQMCVMAGCDFVKALPGIGIKKAHAHIRRTRNIQRAIRGLKFDGIHVPPEYEKKVQRALWTFKYQRVYCPRRKSVVHLNELPEDGLESDGFVAGACALEHGEEDFLGKDVPHSIGQGIAEGRIHPCTWLPFGERTRPPSLSHTANTNAREHSSIGSTGQYRATSLTGWQDKKRLRNDDDPKPYMMQSSTTMRYQSSHYARKSNGQAMAPLGSLTHLLNKALFNASSTCLGASASVRDSPETVKEREKESIRSPVWKPKMVDKGQPSAGNPVENTDQVSLLMPLSPENKKPRADHGLQNFPPLTPGIYLPESYDSPENNAFCVYGCEEGTDDMGLTADPHGKEYYAAVLKEAADSVEAVEKSTVLAKRAFLKPSNVQNKTRKVNTNPDADIENPFSGYFFSK